jgi:hypothetical protein
MDQNIKQEWIEALESGKYRQGSGQLKGFTSTTEDFKQCDIGFCCLGVLCDILAPKGFGYWHTESYIGLDGKVIPDDDVQFEFVAGTSVDNGVLPLFLAEAVGLNQNPIIMWDELPEEAKNWLRQWLRQKDLDDHVNYDLAELNDAGMPFEIIAKVIRKCL